ncbi:MAG: GNAT family N-acetyltransferase [Nannocystaceae bacterium]|nr:GNAT family N-acetyltransferase [Nannocystaceae bacterium]
MRKSIYRGTESDAVAVFERAPFVHVAGTSAEGELILRTLHAVVVEDALVFHGAVVGEKLGLEGQVVVVSAEQVVAGIPSYASDPERACPATTYYRAAQVRGVFEPVDTPEAKAAVMQALMVRFQPEGGYVPITDDGALYRQALRGLRVWRVGLQGAVAKHKLGQNRRPEQVGVVLEVLWQRGEPGDLAAIEILRQARPEVPVPLGLAAPDGVTLCCAPSQDDARAVAALLEGTDWNDGVAPVRRARAHLGSAAWLVARVQGAVIGSVRVVSDGARFGTLADVVVHKDHRGRGIATALLRAVLDHPAVRDVDRVTLRTQDARALYDGLGFEVDADPAGAWSSMDRRGGRAVPAGS